MQNYAEICIIMHLVVGFPFDLAISGKCKFRTRAESAWLTNCLYYYKSIESLETLHDVRERMVTEGRRWWRKPKNGNLSWMPPVLGSQRP